MIVLINLHACVSGHKNRTSSEVLSGWCSIYSAVPRISATMSAGVSAMQVAP